MYVNNWCCGFTSRVFLISLYLIFKAGILILIIFTFIHSMISQALQIITTLSYKKHIIQINKTTNITHFPLQTGLRIQCSPCSKTVFKCILKDLKSLVNLVFSRSSRASIRAKSKGHADFRFS